MLMRATAGAILILLVSHAAVSVFAHGFRGIVPLHSTRADVELLLGKPSTDNYIYKTENEFVRVDYAKGRCEGWPSGWNVPADTVLSLTVRSNAAQVFSALHIDTSDFSTVYDDAFFTYYANRTQGIEYTVSREGVLSSIKYFPAAHDSNFRCKCFPSEDESVFRGVSWDSFEGISMDNIFARLDNFALQLLNSETDWKGYVITYSPLSAGRTGALAFRKHVHDRLIVKRGIDSHRVTIKDGGHRQKFAGELYLLPPGIAAPRPLPTVGSCYPKRVN